MNLSDIEKDIEIVAKAIEQSVLNHNILIGQQQALQHVLNKMKDAAKATEVIVDAAEAVIDPVTIEGA